MILSGRNSCTPYCGQHRTVARKDRMINELQKHMVPGIGTGDNPLAARFWDVLNANAHRGEYNVKDIRDCVARMENTDGNPVVCVFSDAIFPQQKSGTDLRETKCDRRLSNITHAIRTYVEGSFEATLLPLDG